MPPPHIQQGFFIDSPTKDRGPSFIDYKSTIGQVSEYLYDTKASDVPDLYILEIEDFIFHLRRKADAKAWRPLAKKVIKSTYAIVSSLSRIIKHEPGKRSSTTFMHTMDNLYEIMKILEVVYELGDDYQLPDHLEHPN